MGGGGANLLDSPKTGNSNDFESPETDEKNEEEYVVTYKTYDDYFTDLNITAETITEEDLTGSGSANDPYVVHSTRGFLWLTNYNLHKNTLNKKYMTIDCDIILNDEIFDENGTPSGGDGVVYSWKPIITGTNMHIEGKGHSISGLYRNSPMNDVVGLFSTVEIEEMKNLIFENIFLYGLRCVALMPSKVYVLENCQVKSGTIKGEGNIAAFTCTLGKRAKNCQNYAFVNSLKDEYYHSNSAMKYWSAGIAARCQDSVEIEIIDCDNYGKVYSYQRAGGIVAESSRKSRYKIKNCRNFGEIYAKTGNVAGICGLTFESMTVIENCINYGSVTGSGNNGTILGFINGDVLMSGCANYGKNVSTGSSGNANGEMIGRIDNTASNNTEIFIKNCKSYLQDGEKSIFGSSFIENGEEFDNNIKIYVEDCNIKVSRNSTGYLFNSVSSTDLIVKNCSFELTSQNAGVPLVKFINPYANVSLDNVIFTQERNSVSNPMYYYKYSTGNLQADGVLCFCKNKNYFYGTDFSGFYCDWKSGKIGLKALNGKGFFQGEVTEEWLLTKGFVKKVV